MIGADPTSSNRPTNSHNRGNDCQSSLFNCASKWDSHYYRQIVSMGCMLHSEPFDTRQANDSLFENGCKDFTADISPGVHLSTVSTVAGLVSGKLCPTGLSAAKDVQGIRFELYSIGP
jgi:hypothetical protein